MRTRLFGETENDRSSADFLITIDFNDVLGFTDGAAAAVLSVPAGAVVKLVGMKLETPFVFTDTDVEGVTVQLGDGAVDDRYLGGTEVGAAGTYENYSVGSGDGYAYPEADTVDVIFVVEPAALTTPDLSTCTAGKVHLYLSYHDLSQTANS